MIFGSVCVELLHRCASGHTVQVTSANFGMWFIAHGLTQALAFHVKTTLTTFSVELLCKHDGKVDNRAVTANYWLPGSVAAEVEMDENQQRCQNGGWLVTPIVALADYEHEDLWILPTSVLPSSSFRSGAISEADKEYLQQVKRGHNYFPDHVGRIGDTKNVDSSAAPNPSAATVASSPQGAAQVPRGPAQVQPERAHDAAEQRRRQREYERQFPRRTIISNAEHMERQRQGQQQHGVSRGRLATQRLPTFMYRNEHREREHRAEIERLLANGRALVDGVFERHGVRRGGGSSSEPTVRVCEPFFCKQIYAMRKTTRELQEAKREQQRKNGEEVEDLKDTGECTVCLQMTTEDTHKEFTCGHYMCTTCLANPAFDWTCPLCRKAISRAGSGM